MAMRLTSVDVGGSMILLPTYQLTDIDLYIQLSLLLLMAARTTWLSLNFVKIHVIVKCSGSGKRVSMCIYLSLGTPITPVPSLG